MLNVENIHNGDYTDWKIGVTKDINGWVFAAAYVDTNANGSCKKARRASSLTVSPTPCRMPVAVRSLPAASKNAGDSTFIVSVSKSF